MGRCVIDLQNDAVPVRVLNPSVQEYRVTKGTDIASCTPVASVFTPRPDRTDGEPLADNTADGVRKSTRQSLPRHLEDLQERSTRHLECTQRKQALGLLVKFADIFSQNSEDLGRTDLVQHRIHTGAEAPIRQPPRRLPLMQREEAQKQVERMKRYYNDKAGPQTFEPGQSVWLHNPKRRKGISPKLSRPWEGPYLMIECLNDVVYQIQLTPRAKP